ncbi:MAG TPA: hypothetical protein VGN12_06480 [Pirellulales bacterium]|jgi:hypothetical protein
MAFSYDRGSSGGGHQIKAGQAYYDLRMKDDGFTATLQRSGSQVKSFGVAIATVGAKLTALGGILVGPMTAAAKIFKDIAVDTADLAKKLNISVESMSALSYAAERTGTSIKALGTDQEAWQKFFSNAGGEKGLQALIERARELGLVMSSEDAKSAEEYRVALVDLQATLRAITASIGGAVAPILTDMAKRMQATAQRVGEWVRGNRALIAQAFQIAKGVAYAGTAITLLGTAIAGVGVLMGTIATGFTVLVASVTALLSPVGLLVAGLAGMGAYFLYARGTGVAAMSALGGAFLQLKDLAAETFGGISDALSAGDLKLAAQILWATLKAEWVRGTNAIGEIWNEALAGFNELAAKIAPRIVDAWAAVKTGFVKSVAYMGDIWDSLALRMIETWNNSIGKILKTWVKLESWWQGVPKEVSDLLTGTIDIATNIKNKGAGDEIENNANDRERKRNERENGIEDERKRQQGALPDFDAAARAARQRGLEGQLKADDDLARLDAERKRLIAEAAAARQNAVRNNLGGALPAFASSAASSIVGTFSGIGVGRLGTGSALDTIAKNSQRWVVLADQQVRAIGDLRGELRNVRGPKFDE